jgi:hypothetical protein
MGSSASLADLAGIMRRGGAETVIFKMLANNDNSKQQIYFRSDVSILQKLPTGPIYEDGYTEKVGAIFKASVPLSWIDLSGNTARAKGAQFIFYPKYPEVRLSGFLNKCALAPRHLMKPPTRQEREERKARGLHRCMVLGLKQEEVLAYVSDWEDDLSFEAAELIANEAVPRFTDVLYEYDPEDSGSSKTKLIRRLTEVYQMGFVESRKIDKNGIVTPYAAQNGAGFTLESFFGISPNGRSEPDFMDWELKAHSSGTVTLMTPEPDSGSYLEDLKTFLDAYATSRTDNKINFASIHHVGKLNYKSHLTMQLSGYDREKGEIVNPKGGLVLVDVDGNIGAGWSFEKLLNHWKRKHSNTCFVSYEKEVRDAPYYAYGPEIQLCNGAGIKSYLNALASSVIYYDPGINMKFENGRWKPKKRNQFRIKWKDVSSIYNETEDVILS